MLLHRIRIVAVGFITALSSLFLLPTAASANNLQCVPFARDTSGIQIYGDAHTWWKKAAGKYARGKRPVKGAVMAFKPHRNSRLGHVAVVSTVVNSRKVLISHSNWSLINGRRGQIERNVPAIDVSPNNDWSQVRVWYHSIQAIGGTQWPLHGFIYNAKPGSVPSGGAVAVAAPAPIAAPQPKPVIREKSSKAFINAFGSSFENSFR